MTAEQDKIIEEEWLEFIKNIKDNTFLGISTLHQAKLEKYFKLILTKALQFQKQKIIEEIEKWVDWVKDKDFKRQETSFFQISNEFYEEDFEKQFDKDIQELLKTFGEKEQ